ncbi:MAG TPA: NUDIX hydrolase [Gemmatimonadaceae bacterium]|nr:NUDIX hydrolase [Gemmatimonadaceae bacterium]
MPREPIPTWYFAAVVVKHGDRFLLVQERKKDQGWHLPAGRVEPGESLADGAIRETLEESGVKIRLTGILRVEHTPERRDARLRVMFLGEPRGATTTKQKPDRESLRAEWVSLAELPKYKLRRRGVEEVIRYVMNGGLAYPLEVLQEEGMPYPRDRGAEKRGASQGGAIRRLSQSLRTVLIGQQKR